jgi:hypothetical protein
MKSQIKRQIKKDFKNGWLVCWLGVTFTNILQAAFSRADPKNAKKTDRLSVLCALLGSARVKAALRMLMKLTPSGRS